MKTSLILSVSLFATVFLTAQSALPVEQQLNTTANNRNKVTEPKYPPLSFGINLEAGYSGISDRTETYTSSSLIERNQTVSEFIRPGYSLGLWGAYQLGTRWDVQLGANFSQWEAVATSEVEAFSIPDMINVYTRDRLQIRQSLLRLPLEGRFYFRQAEHRVRPFLQLGVQASYLLRHHSLGSMYFTIDGQEGPESVFGTALNLNPERRDYQRWQWSFVGGVGVQLARFSLSVQRNWVLDEGGYQSAAIFDTNVVDGTGNPAAFWVSSTFSRGIRQLRQTSLRFSYRIF